MPRTSRKKSEECVYHVMSRSISEIDLFPCDEDKSYYLSLLKRYKEKFFCKIYAFCLMDNHVHIFINPQGFDISKFMLCLNTAYVVYFNRTYSRHGHLFQGRFASTIVDNDTYSLTLSAYIHNNVKDLLNCAGREDLYRYSSYGIYTGHREDIEGIVDTEFVLKFFSNDIDAAQQKYRAFTESMKETGIMKQVDKNIMRAFTENEYKSEKSHVVRYETPDELLRKLEEILGEVQTEGLRTKYSRETSEFRAFTTYIMRSLCGYTYKQLCQYIGNMSMSGISRLTSEGFRLLSHQTKYLNAFNSLTQTG